MIERPILFSARMVSAILDGKKTQTRRVVKWRDVAAGLNMGFSGLRAESTPAGWVLESDTRSSREWRCKPTPSPYGQPGDRLWVRETWSTHACFDHLPPNQCPKSIHYWADGKVQTGKGRPSIHMPRWASRITLEITGLRVERLQAISEADALHEGADLPLAAEGLAETRKRVREIAFPALWESINGPDSWAANPWVWVVEFKRVDAS